MQVILSPAGPKAPAGEESDMDPPPPPSLGARWSGVEGGLQQGQEQAPFPEIPGLYPLSRALHQGIFPGCSASPELWGKDGLECPVCPLPPGSYRESYSILTFPWSPSETHFLESVERCCF